MTTHPSLESLLDLTLNELPEDRASEVREHLLDCRECRTQVKELLEHPTDPPAGEARLSDSERSEAWNGLAERLAAEGVDLGAEPPIEIPDEPLGTVTPFSPDRSPAPPASISSRAWPTGFMSAAAAVVLAFGAGILAGRAQETYSRTETQAALWTHLSGEAATHRGGGEPGSELPVICLEDKRAWIWALSLGSASPSPIARFRVEIAFPNGSHETLDQLLRDDFGRILLTRPQDSTPEGAYTIQVFPEGQPEVLESFRFVVSCS